MVTLKKTMNKDVKVNAWIEAQFSPFDEFLKRCAVDSELEFRGRAGTVRGRSLRKRSGRLLVAIDLFMTNSFIEVYERPDDEDDLPVKLVWAAWLYQDTDADKKSFWFLSETCYTGTIAELKGKLEPLVNEAVESVKRLTPELVKTKGVFHS